MSEQIWQDNITGTHYYCSDSWLQHVRTQLAAAIRVEMENSRSQQDAANRVARYWRNQYYRLLFPLRFGRMRDEQGLFTMSQRINATEKVLLDGEHPLRQVFLDGSGWPPVWPDPELGNQGWLRVDRLLIETALLNIIARQTGQLDDATVTRLRLAALIYPLRQELASAPWLDDQVQQWVKLLNNRTTTGIAHQQETILPRLKRVLDSVSPTNTSGLGKMQVGLVLVAAQRIKQYVFDTPGLNEIRGGSTILDRATDDLVDLVEGEIGPEVILRAGGATLLFLAPADRGLTEWPSRLRRKFFVETKAAFPAAGQISVSIETLLHNFSGAVSQIFSTMGEDRAQAALPRFTTYPFETRCTLCQSRAAYDWEEVNDIQQPICEVCKTKRQIGQAERRDKVWDILVDLGITDYDDPNVRLDVLGIKGATRKAWLAQDLDGLIHQRVRRRLIGVVYGDGNNFGAVQINMKDMALNLQWAARLENTTRAAVALALGCATQKAAQQYGWQPGGAPILDKLPFQVLALGGDDLSLFAWGPVAIHFADAFTRFTDLEFKVCQAESDIKRPSLNFSLGVLLTDEKTPVRKSVYFTESALLKWAKQANKTRCLTCGTITMLYAEKADKVPADLETYRKELYLIGRGRQFQLCATLRPYTAAELTALLQVADKIVKERYLGRLERLVSAFYGAREGAFAGMLHYAYQKGRFSDDGWIAKIERELVDALSTHVSPTISPLLINYTSTTIADLPPTPFGIELPKPKEGERSPIVHFSPLWDLLELAKLIS